MAKIRSCDESNPQILTFCTDSYGNSDEMWKDITMFLRMLMKNGMIAVIKDEDCGIISVQYNYNDESMGTSMPYWMTPEDAWGLQNDEAEDDDDQQ